VSDRTPSSAPPQDPAPSERRDFIREIVAADVAAGRIAAPVTRFPPEPNGYLHIGHAKSIARPATPAFMDFAAMAKDGSMLNTPPTFAWYMAGLVFQWLKRQGGLKGMGERNRAKAEKLYAAIDGSSFYRNPVAKDARSWMNVPFTLANPELDKTFVAEAKHAGLVTLEGHRSVGGMRASLYNAMPMEGVNALVGFMQEFARKHG
jgi:phosphoserine aminotransferase